MLINDIVIIEQFVPSYNEYSINFWGSKFKLFLYFRWMEGNNLFSCAEVEVSKPSDQNFTVEFYQSYRDAYVALYYFTQTKPIGLVPSSLILDRKVENIAGRVIEYSVFALDDYQNPIESKDKDFYVSVHGPRNITFFFYLR